MGFFGNNTWSNDLGGKNTDGNSLIPHTHLIGNITNLRTELSTLDAKIDTVASTIERYREGIEATFVAHITDADLHLTSEEKAKLNVLD